MPRNSRSAAADRHAAAAPGRALRVVVVTGIFPPDVGGPATHAADLAQELRQRGHEVVVLSLCDERRPILRHDLVRFPRRWPWPLRLAAVVGWLIRRRHSYDVCYATGMQLEAVAGARLGGRPVVVKVVGDPAWERGRRLGLVEVGFGEFQQGGRFPVGVRAMRAARTQAVRWATAVTVPSSYLAEVVKRWTGGKVVADVVPNGVRGARAARPKTGAGGRLRAVYVGRLVAHKQLDVVLQAVASTRGVELDVVGDGPERANLEMLAARLGLDDVVAFSGPLEHDEVMERLADAHVLVTVASYEGLPHTVLEALVCATPVLASAAGGTTEALVDGENALIVDPVSVESVATALRRLRDDPELLPALSRGAARSAPRWSFAGSVDMLEVVFARLLQGESRPAAVFVGRTTVPSEPPPELVRKFGIFSRHLSATVLALGPAGVRRVGGVRVVTLPRFRPAALGTFVYYVVASGTAVLVASRRRGAVVCQSPYEGFVAAVLRSALPPRARPALVVEVHGDWRTAATLYGTRARRPLAPLADWVASCALRHADRVRVIGRFTESLVREAGYRGPLDSYLTFTEFGRFLEAPLASLPERPRAAYVGALELSKGPDVLIEAWAQAFPLPEGAELVIVGDGHLRRELEERCRTLGIDKSVRFVGRLRPTDVITTMDGSWFLALPSRSEGMGRVGLEAMARGRAVLGSRVGGIPEVVEDGHTGILVPPGDPTALAAAISGLLHDRKRAAALGGRARRQAERRDLLAEYDSGTARLARWIEQRGYVEAAGS